MNNQDKKRKQKKQFWTAFSFFYGYGYCNCSVLNKCLSHPEYSELFWVNYFILEEME